MLVVGNPASTNALIAAAHVCSYPVVSRDGRWEVVGGFDVDDFSRRHIDSSVAELVEERDAVRGLGRL